MFALALGICDIPRPPYQLVFLENGVNGIQIKIGIKIKHRVVFIVKSPVRIGAFAITTDQVPEIIIVAGDMMVRIHRHKTRKLQETRINTASRSGIAGRHSVNHIVFKPFHATLHSQVAHYSW